MPFAGSKNIDDRRERAVNRIVDARRQSGGRSVRVEPVRCIRSAGWSAPLRRPGRRPTALVRARTEIRRAMHFGRDRRGRDDLLPFAAPDIAGATTTAQR